MVLSNNKAELLGIHAGDGTLYKTGKVSIVLEIRGSIKEKDYYDDIITPLVNKIFNLDIKANFRNGGKCTVYGIRSCKRKVYEFLKENGFNVGSKVYIAKIPKTILQAKKSIKESFVRGLFDTDGCLYIQKNGTKRYPRVEWGFASKNLRDDLNIILNNLGFRCTTWVSKSYRLSKLCISYKLRIFGNEYVEKFFKEIKPNNSKHLNKYFKWKRLYAGIA